MQHSRQPMAARKGDASTPGEREKDASSGPPHRTHLSRVVPRECAEHLKDAEALFERGHVVVDVAVPRLEASRCCTMEPFPAGACPLRGCRVLRRGRRHQSWKKVRSAAGTSYGASRPQDIGRQSDADAEHPHRG